MSVQYATDGDVRFTSHRSALNLVHIMAVVSITNGNPNYNTSGVIILPVHTLTHSLYFAREKLAASDTLIIPYQEMY